MLKQICKDFDTFFKIFLSPKELRIFVRSRLRGIYFFRVKNIISFVKVREHFESVFKLGKYVKDSRALTNLHVKTNL